MSEFEKSGHWGGFTARGPCTEGLSGNEVAVVLTPDGWVVISPGWKSISAYPTPLEALNAYQAALN